MNGNLHLFSLNAPVVRNEIGNLRLLGWLLWLSCLLLSHTVSQTVSPQKVLGRYQQFAWQDQHGLPQNGISAVVQTPDGYLWLATAEGLVRFDGVRFTAFDTSNTNEIKSNNVQSLLVDGAGALWIGTHGGGLSRYQDGRFALYSSQDGLSDSHIKCLFEDRAGHLWVGTDGGGLNVFQKEQQGRDGRFTVYTTANGLPDNRVWALAEDAAGGLWVGTNGGLARFKDGRFTTYTMRDGLASDRVRALCWDRAGHLWVGMVGGLSRFREGRFTSYDARDGLKNNYIQVITQDREDNLWFGTNGGGLYRLKDGRFAAYTAQDGSASDEVQAIFQSAQDPEGDIWLGTSGGGLVQLRDGRFGVYTTEDGLPHNMVGAVYEDATGGVWIGTLGGLGRFKAGKLTVITTPEGRPYSGVNGITQDRAGNFWINTGSQGTGNQVLRFREGDTIATALTARSIQAQTMTVLEDRAGHLWFGTPYDGLHRFSDGRRTVYHKQDGLAGEYVCALYEDRAGSLWIGTRSGVSRFKDGRFTTWTAQAGFTGNHVLSFYEDRAGSLWIGTHGDGLFRFKDGKFAVITSKDGLYDNLAFQILSDTDDDSGNLWMSGNKGIYRASLKELHAFADGHIATVNSFAYGVADGMLSRECNGANPAGVRTRDGKLWFPTIKGVVVVDPQKLNQRPPPVAIEQVLLDRAALPSGQAIQINPGQEKLEIQYTALSWNRPQQIKFKYQLVGLDHDWVEAGTRRTAYYPYLPPGEYAFRVIADNGEGVWNTTGQSLRIVVRAPFYQRGWFLALVLAGSTGLVWIAWKLRVKQLDHRQAQQEAFARRLIESQENERKRIAAELHDSLGQSLAIIKNRAFSGTYTVNDLETAKDYFEAINAETAQAITDVREIAQNLRPYLLDRLGLTRALQAMLDKVADSCEFKLETSLENIDGLLPAAAEMSLYRIVQESLNNIIKHAEASQVRVTIRRAESELLILIEDNGKGFDPNEIYSKSGEGKQRGFGLLGITERVRMLSGKQTIQSTPGQGTRISLVFGCVRARKEPHQ